MATIPAAALEDIVLTAALGRRLALIFVFGPGFLVLDGFQEIEQALSAERCVLRHRLDRDGPNIAETVAAAEDPRPVVLVHGLERMLPDGWQTALAELNLLRDTLSMHPAVLVVWVPSEAADDFRALCIDLFQWRVLSVFVDAPPPDSQSEQRRVRHRYLVHWAAGDVPSAPTMIERRVIIWDDGTREVGAWLERVRRGLLLGDAGSGKTTELHRYVKRQASAMLDGVENELPIFIAARHLDASLNEWGALARRVEPQDEPTRAWLEQQLASACVVLIVDGIDEVPARQRAVVKAHLLELLARRPDLRVIVSSRDGSTERRWSGWERATLEPLSLDAAAAWLQALGVKPDRVALALSGPAADLARSPLSLGFLAELLDRPEQPPSVITALAKMVVDRRIVQYRDANQSYQRLIVEPSRTVMRFMSDLAAAMTRAGRPLLDTSTVRALAAELGAGRGDDQLERLQPAIERSGLLRQSEAGYSFVHELFREYFAGLWLVENASEQLAEYAVDPAWQRAVVHALALLAPRELEAAFDQVWTSAESLPPKERWRVRQVALEGALQTRNLRLRERTLDRGLEAVAAAQQAGESPDMWMGVAELLDADTKT